MKFTTLLVPFALESVGSLGITFAENQIIYAISSLFIAFGIFAFAKLIINSRLRHLKGSSKLLGLISVAIGGGEIIYLGINFGIFNLALELIAYLGIGLWLFLIPFQTSLKNMASGISNYMNTEMDIGDIVEVKGKRGVIIEFHLTKTILLSENGERVSVPNYKFSEDVVCLDPKNPKISKISNKPSSIDYWIQGEN